MTKTEIKNFVFKGTKINAGDLRTPANIRKAEGMGLQVVGNLKRIPSRFKPTRHQSLRDGF
jgi:hypothetical protein